MNKHLFHRGRWLAAALALASLAGCWTTGVVTTPRHPAR